MKNRTFRSTFLFVAGILSMMAIAMVTSTEANAGGWTNTGGLAYFK